MQILYTYNSKPVSTDSDSCKPMQTKGLLTVNMRSCTATHLSDIVDMVSLHVSRFIETQITVTNMLSGGPHPGDLLNAGVAVLSLAICKVLKGSVHSITANGHLVRP